MSNVPETADPSQTGQQQQKESEEQLNLLQTISREVAGAPDLSSALRIVIRLVCEKTDWAIGQAWLPSADGSELVCDSSWVNKNGEAGHFQSASAEMRFKPGEGLPGRVWQSKRPAWVDDVTADSNFPRAAVARAAGLKTGAAIPILSGERVVAVVEFFMRGSREQNERLLNVIASVASQLDLLRRLTVQREREQVLRESHHQLELTVTDRTAELSRTNDILRSILSNMGDAVIVADRDGKFVLFNPAAERMFGQEAPQTPPNQWSKTYGLFLPDKTTPFPYDQLPLLRSVRGEEVDNAEMYVRHERLPQGLWTRITGRPLRDADGGLLGGVIVCRDITAIKEEEFFRAGQSRVLEMIAANLPLAEVLEALVLLMECQSAGLRCSILLLHRDGKHVRHGAAPNLPETYVKAVDGAPIGPRNGSCGTAMYLRKPVVVTDVMSDPLWKDYRELAKICGLSACWSTPIISPKGDVLGSFAMYREEKRGPRPEENRLTQIATHIAGIAIQRQRNQEILRERDERINLVAESADLAFWILYPDGTNAWMSEKGRLMYGFDSNLPLTCDLILSRIHPDERAKVKAEYEKTCVLLGSFESEHRLLLPHGKIRWVIMRGRCLKDAQDNLLETIGMTLDVSMQKEASLALQLQREEMAHRNRVSLMGEMTASFAHEINQPLTAIVNSAAAARRFLERGKMNPELLQEILQDMINDSKRAGEIIRGIRSLVRKNTGVHTLLNLNSVISDTVRLVSTDVVARQCVVETELDPQLPEVKADPVQLQQILLNLFVNAMDAMESLPPVNRRIVIRTRSDKGEMAEVSVRDFGTGLPTDRPERVFDAFFSTKQHGMGMGLAIVRSIVETHGGTIIASNEPDRGARIVIRLPAARETAQRQAAA